MKDLQQFITSTFGFSEIWVQENFLNVHHKDQQLGDIARKFAAFRVKDVLKPHLDYVPLYGEIEFERRFLEGKVSTTKGILYEGLQFLLYYTELLPSDENVPDALHIVLTDRLLGTYSQNDGRYHIRSILCGSLSLISLSGIVEGPAKPRVFYKLKHQGAAMGTQVPIELLKEQFKGQFIDYNDERITEVLKGFISQALFFNLTGEPFCTERNCRLFNAHWQSELIQAQITSGEFCSKHKKYLENLRRNQ